MTLLSFNTALLDYRVLGFSLFRPVRFVEKRLMTMVAQLQQLDADIVSLQEVYSLKHKLYLAKALQMVYPFSFFETKNRWGQLSSGLMILSKCPMVYSVFESYQHQPFEERVVTKKGIMSVVVASSRGRLVVTNTHTTASGSHFKQDSSRIAALRHTQIEQTIQATCRLKKDWQCQTAFICGDFNCSPEIAPLNYTCVEQCGFVDLYKKVHHNEDPTWDTDNPLNSVRSFFKTSPKQRIDFIFGEAQYDQIFKSLGGKIVFKEACVQTSPQSFVPLSDHYGVLIELY